jgi:hypothetical protein
VIDPFAAALVGASVLALWDYGRRWLQIRETEASASRNYERTYQMMRDEVSRTDERTDELASKVADHTLALHGHHASIEGETVRAEMERRLDSHLSSIEAIGSAYGGRLQKLEQAPSKDSETEVAIRTLFDRCDTNSKAIVNTAESMQKVLNEKFTALALARGVNQRTG